MKAILAAAAFLVSAAAFGNGYMTGDKIHFQKDSTWVNSYYNKTICLNDVDVYEAVVTTCVKWNNGRDDDRNCMKYGKKKIFQPMVSTRLRCDSWGGRDSDCDSWVTVDYVQSPKRTVKFFDEGDQLKKTVTYTIKACGSSLQK